MISTIFGKNLFLDPLKKSMCLRGKGPRAAPKVWYPAGAARPRDVQEQYDLKELPDPEAPKLLEIFTVFAVCYRF